MSRDGIVPIAESQDTAGPMTKSVADVAYTLGALTGVDPKDPRTSEIAGEFHTDYTPFLAGVPVELLPRELVLDVGDALVVRNRDDADRRRRAGAIAPSTLHLRHHLRIAQGRQRWRLVQTKSLIRDVIRDDPASGPGELRGAIDQAMSDIDPTS